MCCDTYFARRPLNFSYGRRKQYVAAGSNNFFIEVVHEPDVSAIDVILKFIVGFFPLFFEGKRAYTMEIGDVIPFYETFHTLAKILVFVLMKMFLKKSMHIGILLKLS